MLDKSVLSYKPCRVFFYFFLFFIFEKQTHTHTHIQGRGKGILTQSHTTTPFKSIVTFKGGLDRVCNELL